MEKIISYLRKHWNEKYTIDDLCRIFCTSSSRLTASFRKATGMSIADYRTMLKLDQACKMLTKRSLSQKEIARYLGFSSVSNFSDFFRKKSGMAPGEWRKAHS